MAEPLPCADWLALMSGLATAGDSRSLAALAGEGRALCLALLREGGGPRLVGRCLAAVSDQVTRRAIVLAGRAHRLPEVPWCWLSFGSEGREEQTLVTDQDNGIVFLARDEAEASSLQPWFLPFARQVNEYLAAAGYRLCDGNIMAGNPDCCRSLDQWQQVFHHWLRCPEPEALLNGTIFFDLRPVHGEAGLCARLQEAILEQVAQAPAFLHLFCDNALAVAPPLGMLGELHPDEQGGLDLKKFGTRLFVDGARILALAHGVAQVQTVARLEAAGPLAGMAPGDVQAAVQAFLHLQGLRLEHQVRALDQGQAADNRIRPEQLAEMQQAMLKAVLRQARALQHKLGHSYGFIH